MQYNKLQIEKLRELPQHGQDPFKDASEKTLAYTTMLKSMPGLFSDITTSGKSMFTALGDGATSAQRGMQKMLGIQVTFGEQLKALAKHSTFLERRNAALNKSFGISSIQAAKYGSVLDKANESLHMGGEYLRAYTINLNKLLPGQAKNIKYESQWGQTLLKTQDLLITRMGLTGDEANNVELLAARRQQSSQEYLADQAAIADLLETETGQIGVFRDVTAALAGMASDTRTQFGRMPGNLEVSILKARALGTTVESLAKTGRGMLDIEKSVNAELEYQQLSGKRLIANGKNIASEYRNAFVTGDATKMAQAQEDILRTQGDVIDNNVLAREALAKMMGIETKELMRQREQMLLIDEAGKEGINLNVNAKDFEQKLEDAIANTKDADKKALLEQIKVTSDTRTTEQKILQTLDAIYTEGILRQATEFGGQEALIRDTQKFFTKTAMSEMRKFSEKITKTERSQLTQALGDWENQSTWYQDTKTYLNTIKDAMPGVGKLFNKVIKVFDKISDLIKGDATVWKEKGVVNISDAKTVNVTTTTKTTGDLAIRAGGGPAVLGPEGTLYQGSRNDDVAMGPGVVATAKGGGSSTIDANSILQLVNAIENISLVLPDQGMNQT